MNRLICAVLLGSACASAVPTPSNVPDLPPLTAQATGEELRITLGPQGRQALIGEFKLTPETFGVDLSRMVGDNPGIHSGVVWCVEPQEWLGDTLVIRAGLTWWPPGIEPKQPTKSITEALMRCLGFLESKPWSSATIYLRPASLPRVDVGAQRPLLQEGTDTLSAALEQAFNFGIAAPFQARGLSFLAGTQDGSVAEAERGVARRGQASVRSDADGWSVSNRILFSATEEATAMPIFLGKKADTVVEGVSYLIAKGRAGELLPSALSRAALRIKTGLGRSMVTMTALARAESSPGLSCVLRALSPPQWAKVEAQVRAQQAEQADGGAAAAPSADGGEPQPEVYPGVDLEAARKCQLTDVDQSGPPLTFK